MKAVARLAVFIILVIVFFPFVWLSHIANLPLLRQRLLMLFYNIILRLWGIKLQVNYLKGAYYPCRPSLLVSNHCSYFDVAVLGALFPAQFTPKKEVRAWPVIGYLCEIAGCIFIDRKRSKTNHNHNNILQQISRGAVISLFPEGTTNNGFTIKPFRSALFSVASHSASAQSTLPVIPITIQYFTKKGELLAPQYMDKVAWYGDMEFAGHLWQFLHEDGVLAVVTVHPHVTINQFSNRKELTTYCQQQVESHFIS